MKGLTAESMKHQQFAQVSYFVHITGVLTLMLSSTLNNNINFINFYIEQRNYFVMSTSVGSYLIIFPKANRVDPDQAALTRAA